MQELYGIDLSQPGLLDERSWRWLEVRLAGLLEQPCRSRLERALGRSYGA